VASAKSRGLLCGVAATYLGAAATKRLVRDDIVALA